MNTTPQVGELWRSQFGNECIITGVLEDIGIFKYHTVFPNGHHYDGAFNDTDLATEGVKKLADKAPDTHPALRPESDIKDKKSDKLFDKLKKAA